MNKYKVRTEDIEYTIKADYFKIEDGSVYFYLYGRPLPQHYVANVCSIILISEK